MLTDISEVRTASITRAISSFGSISQKTLNFNFKNVLLIKSNKYQIPEIITLDQNLLDQYDYIKFLVRMRCMDSVELAGG
jgi:hypothetical protein